jgi:undecaprenyl-diphosphatase
MQFHALLKNKAMIITTDTFAIVIVVFVVVGRLISGVHWFTDIIGSLLLGSAFVLIYWLFVQYIKHRSALQKLKESQEQSIFEFQTPLEVNSD